MSTTITNTPSRTIKLLFLGDPRFDRRIRNFARFFINRQWTVEIIAGIFSPPPAIEVDGIPCRIIPLSYSSGPRKFLQYHRKLSSLLVSLPKSELLFACDLYSLLASRRAKKKNMCSTVFYDAREIYTALPTVEHRPVVRWVWKQVERTGLKETDIVITTAPFDANAILNVHRFLPRSVVIKNMPSLSATDDAQQYLRSHFSIPSGKSILVYVGGLQKDRGLEKIIQVVKELNDAVVVLIGDGVLRESLEQLVRQLALERSVFFYGSAPSETVLGLLHSADVGLSIIERNSGSYELALPSKLFEYLHCGLPVVSSPLQQVIDTINKSDVVFYCDENNPDEIVQSIRKAIALSKNSAVREQIIADAKRCFVFESDAEKLLPLLS